MKLLSTLLTMAALGATSAFAQMSQAGSVAKSSSGQKTTG